MKKLILYTLLVLPLIGYSQGKHDYNWLIGVEQDPNPDVYPINCMNLLSFEQGELSIEKLSVGYPMYAANASISDVDGDLLFYSNGCDVKNREHDIMPNGDILNPGPAYDNNCPDGGYSTLGGIIIIPAPNQSELYYVFHQAFAYFNESPFVRVNRLYFSVVDMSLNNGLGDVTLKNQVVLKSIQYTGLQAVRHSNNEDWWLMSMEEGGNKYYRVLLTSNGISEVDSQIIGNVLSLNGGGQPAFSPDGTKFAKYDFMDQLMLFDFDRNTGLLSDYKQLEIDTPSFSVCGLAFSPNSKRLYLSNYERLWQLDLEAPDLLASKTLIGEWDGFVYEFFNLLFPVYFQQMRLGPDCRIYMTSNGPVAYMHIIHNPDELGTACNFEQRGLPLPCSVNYSIPNFPHYRLGTGQPVCDSSIVYVSSGYVPPPAEEEVRVWPNPASREVKVELNETVSTQPSKFSLFDGTGRLVGNWELSAGSHEATLSLSNLPDGMYFWHVESWGMYVKSGKLIISR
jgi:WD40 repeat protein